MIDAFSTVPFFFVRFSLLLVRKPDKIITADAVKTAKPDQVLDLKLRSAFLNVAIALLGFVDDLRNVALRQIPILS